VLQEGEVTRIGGAKVRKVDVRVLAATNKKLEQEIADGRFREDLYYRLNVVPITVPPLRDRRDDIPMLVQHFLARIGKESGLPAKLVDPEAMERLLSLEWPGNIRELRNTVERLLILALGTRITRGDVDRLVGVRAGDGGAAIGALEHFDTYESFKMAAERAFLLAKLREHDWNVAETARAIDMPRSNLYKKIERHALARGQG
jgi:two-component system nitrogen regulation response regulator NtrX